MKWNQHPINKITVNESEYPELLKQYKDPPKELFYRGSWDPKLFEKSLAVVGSRRITHYGREVLSRLIPPLVAEGLPAGRQGVTIISGFMYGVDSQAHQECVEDGGRTIAVLGGGLNVLYPPENEKLYQEIISGGGLIISEYPPDQQPQLWTFVQRNRIVAGLATLGVLVIEAGEKSGSLITAKLAKNQGKPVFAVPGPITSAVSAGANKLIKDGLAKMVLGANDLLPGILPENRSKPADDSRQNYSPEEQQILKILSAEPLTIDEISQKTGSNIVKIGQTITMMTLKGLLEERNGQYCLTGSLS